MGSREEVRNNPLTLVLSPKGRGNCLPSPPGERARSKIPPQAGVRGSRANSVRHGQTTPSVTPT